MSDGKIRILYTIPNFDTAGSGLLLYHILSRLDRDRFHPEVSVLRITNTITENRIRQLGVDIYQSNFDIPIRPYRSLVIRARKSAKAFREGKYDIWHSFHYSDSYTEPLISKFAGKVKWVYTKKAMGWGSRAWKLKSVLADAIVADNTDMLKEFFSGWPLQRKVHFIPHSVDPEVYQPKVRPMSQEGRDARNIVLCVVAHLVPVKGHPTLLEALRGCPNTTLLIAGRTNDTGYYNELRSLIQQYNLDGRVHFLGAVSDIPSLHAETDIFVLPTWARWRMEGCPVALLEAMACGKACIATDIPGSRDLIEHERSGVLVPPENAEALRAAINRLAHDSEFRDRLGKAARQRVLDHFTIEREVRQHEELYMSLLGLK